MKNNVAFIGLGVMGYPMAGHLSRHGYPTKVYNRTTKKAHDWAKDYHGEACSSPGAAAQDCDLVFVCVGNDDDVRSVVYGEMGLINNMKPGSILVDHTTTSAELAVELSVACKQKGIAFIDAPVSGGQAGAENGALTIMCGGQSDAFEQAAPVMSAYGKQSKLMGENGQGQRSKMVNQICIAGVLKGLSEGLTLAKRSGLDIDDLVEVLKHGAAGSWQMENRSSTMSRDEFDFGFAIDWMRKDLGICIDESKRLGIDLPLTTKVDDEYRELQNSGYGRMDTSVLIKTYQEAS
ncbi:NAD(P)-dependent oxidoreductase [Vibrio coralliilyticus]|jgi:3-hydroxyisobutyrate dehydrogenase|uniref:2-hydroxy-3-oxopropionate reductase n=1 Tax=Vibrio coralliilyticus TaxID=190893 RepID=A0AAJ3EGN2_9VIBR|nr:NAD(P)-dependent oxidoreductase [Vibrio coralliilyticus]AIW22823.1 2-hydroxy-3-oxopropionate reductase [Vibrio coralliilyticus]NOH38140.1 NAD(P)-dependent oxidoreductase [Vibrio coralliilyticus]NOH55147.1 NAD(P)-dependent oxidoreductase [Vibrio coralliilyticus]NOI77323.1 NAD(P)-dependent oxidoreductase [Vibrio coralliilyticus]PAW02837.1 NAD(P)-dependent oxidoreductase [Vibrio coralliilyticus]